MHVNIIKGTRRKLPRKKNESYKDYIGRVVKQDMEKRGMEPSENLYVPPSEKKKKKQK